MVPTRSRSRLFSLPIGASLAGALLLLAGLAVVEDPRLSMIAAVGGLACLMAAAVAWVIGRGARGPAASQTRGQASSRPHRRSQPLVEPVVSLSSFQSQLPAAPSSATQPPASRRPIRVQSLPVAELPPAYLDAVTKGVRANRQALREGRGKPDAEAR